jgi:hypothetical protein
MKRKSEGWRGYAVHVQAHPAGWDWMVTGIDGRAASGRVADAGSARWCCDFTIAALEALRRVGQRRF